VTSVVGAGAVTGAGCAWRGLGRAALAGARIPADVPPLAPADDPTEPRTRKLMSRSARLCAVATRKALDDAGWRDGREAIGFYLGVGPSAGDMAELTPVLAAALEGGELSLPRLGTDGLAACNPLLTFQLLNNFTLCHAAILEGIGGPNGAFFSRGGGTVAALVEARHALASGDADRALCGGADCAVHPVTSREIRREGLLPAEGAAILALAARADAPLARIERCQLGREAATCDAPPDVVLVAAWSAPAAAPLVAAARARHPDARVIDLSCVLGEALAATPALAWVTAVDLIAHEGFCRAQVISAGTDGDVGTVVLTS
jgi:hypothetical protein